MSLRTRGAGERVGSDPLAASGEQGTQAGWNWPPGDTILVSRKQGGRG